MSKDKPENIDLNNSDDPQETDPYLPISSSSPIVPIARGNNNDQLWRRDYYEMDSLIVKVPVYDGMEPGQSISITWRGPNPRLDYNDTRVVTEIEEIIFSIPRPNVIDAIGANVRIAYSVLDLEGNTEDSQTTMLSVERQPMILPITHINLPARRITISYPEMDDTQVVSLNWYGWHNYSFEPQPANDSGSLVFDIPQEWIDENSGNTVYLIYAVEIDPTERNIFSRVAVVNIN